MCTESFFDLFIKSRKYWRIFRNLTGSKAGSGYSILKLCRFSVQIRSIILLYLTCSLKVDCKKTLLVLYFRKFKSCGAAQTSCLDLCPHPFDVPDF